MWPAIFVFGGVALVAWAFTKVGGKSPLTNSAAVQGNIAAVKPNAPTKPAAKPAPLQPSQVQTLFTKDGGLTAVKFDEGSYKVIAPSGLRIHAKANKDSQVTGVANLGAVVHVLQDVGNGWVQLHDPQGFVCNKCVDAPGGPWLVAVEEQPVTASTLVATDTVNPDNPNSQDDTSFLVGRT